MISSDIHYCPVTGPDAPGDEFDCQDCRNTLYGIIPDTDPEPPAGHGPFSRLSVLPPAEDTTDLPDPPLISHDTTFGTSPFKSAGPLGGMWVAMCSCGWAEKGTYEGTQKQQHEASLLARIKARKHREGEKP